MPQPIYCSACGYECGQLPDDLNDDLLVYCACGQTLGAAFSLRAFAAGEARTTVNVVLQPNKKMQVSVRRTLHARSL
jgi:hypothetical protein